MTYSSRFEDFNYPFISIVVAARNEEENIKRCIESLTSQSYPADKYEIWIGDDQSGDNTNSIVRELIKNNKNLFLLEIKDQWKHLQGKANVLAQVIRKTKGEYILITDADVRANPDWIKRMVLAFQDGSSLLTGATVVEGKSIMAQLQRAEWIFYVGNGHLQSQKGNPVSAIGNNMAITRKSYESVGRYENIPFSIVEDWELFKAVTSKGGSFKTLFEPSSLAFTQPIHSINTLFHQRKRWIRGVFQLPMSLSLGVLFIWNLLLFFIIIGVFFGWKIMLLLFMLKWIADIFFLNFLYKKLSLHLDLGSFLYTPYSIIFNTLFLCFYFWPIKTNWKGRRY
jgi:cellulose synthase/poly-beta-1,6-N-acetylglucosamine synthase-like glycosyltransferase